MKIQDINFEQYNYLNFLGMYPSYGKTSLICPSYGKTTV